MVYVKKKPGQDDNALIKDFSRRVMEAGIVEETKRRKFHLKPSLAKKLKKKLRQQAAARMRIYS